MKWMTLVLVTALVLIAAGLLLNRGPGPDHLSDDPRAQALCEEGTADVNAFRLREGVKKLGRSLELDPSLAEASIARAAGFLRLGRIEQFKRELARADSLTARLADDRRRMLAQLRLSAMSQSSFHSMRDSLLAVLEKEMPDNIYVLVAQASRPEVHADPARQEKAWLRILEVDPNYANSYNMLGYLELNRGNYDQAIEYMQKYAFLAPGQANPHDSMGEVLMVMGRYEEAEQEFIQSVQIQPDFYHSLINLGKVHLYRGQIAKGVDILEKVRDQVRGSTLERRVDEEVINIFVNSNLDGELDRLTADFIARYPRDRASGFFRAVRLAAAGRPDQGRAVMDSCLAAWRQEAEDKGSNTFRLEIENTDREYAALAADYNGAPAERVVLWREALDEIRDAWPFHYQWFYRYRLASALRDDGRPDEALAELEPMLRVNPRLIDTLELAVRCAIDLGDRRGAAGWLALLEKSVADSDPDFYGRERAAELAARIAEMPTGT